MTTDLRPALLANGHARGRPPVKPTPPRLMTDLACRSYVPAGPTPAERFDAARRKLMRTAGAMAARELARRGVTVTLSPSGAVRAERTDGRRLTPRQEAKVYRHRNNLALYLASL